ITITSVLSRANIGSVKTRESHSMTARMFIAAPLFIMVPLRHENSYHKNCLTKQSTLFLVRNKPAFPIQYVDHGVTSAKLRLTDSGSRTYLSPRGMFADFESQCLGARNRSWGERKIWFESVSRALIFQNELSSR